MKTKLHGNQGSILAAIRRFSQSNFFVEALRSSMNDSDFSDEIPMSAQNIDSVINSGLGPFFNYLLTRSGIASGIDRQLKLKSSDITARILTTEQFQNITAVLDSLRCNDVEVDIVLRLFAA